jgi:hypothetical protein
VDIIVTHLTRMRPGHICAAGVCPQDGTHVRPLLGGGHNLGVAMLARNGGVFALGRRLSLGEPQRPELIRPHLEDWIIHPRDPKLQEVLSPRDFWALLERQCTISLSEVFGAQVERIGATSFGTRPCQGGASLAYVRLTTPLSLHLRERQEKSRQLRAQFPLDGVMADLPVTDERLYTGHAHVLNEPLVARLQQALQQASETIVAVGLGRPYPPDDPRAMNWLQVNNVFPEPCPMWEKAADLT